LNYNKYEGVVTILPEKPHSGSSWTWWL